MAQQSQDQDHGKPMHNHMDTLFNIISTSLNIMGTSWNVMKTSWNIMKFSQTDTLSDLLTGTDICSGFIYPLSLTPVSLG